MRKIAQKLQETEPNRTRMVSTTPFERPIFSAAPLLLVSAVINEEKGGSSKTGVRSATKGAMSTDP